MVKNEGSLLLYILFTPVPGSDLTIARSSKHKYNDYGEWNNSGKANGHIGVTFTAAKIIISNYSTLLNKLAL
jgi:hypothetical protein